MGVNPKTRKNPDLVTINQLVDKRVYAKIKSIATLENKYVSEVVEDALDIYAKGYEGNGK